MTTTTSASRPWTPTEQDRLIYRWVKFDGHKQSWVAQQLEMHQSTVSRIVERYERWIAHGGPAQQGALNRDERLRAQLWLNHERNEWIITSALRMAGEMERLSDTSKSTTKHYRSQPSREIEVRTEDSIRDRTGMACRYLRLAHQVGKNQLELIKQLDLPDLEPFTLDEHEYVQALEDIKPKYVEVPTNVGRGSPDPALNAERDSSDLDPQTPLPLGEGGSPSGEPGEGLREFTVVPALTDASLLPPPMPSVHNHAPFQSPPTPTPTVTSVEIAPHKKPTARAYASLPNPPEPTDPLAPILNATVNQPLPPIRILPLFTPIP